MANFRMFSKSVTENDKFYTLSAAAQGLYLHLVMNADDDGVVDSPIGIRRAAGMTEADFQELIDRGYILYRENVAVIVHWKAQNTIKEDRYTPTEYPEALVDLTVDKKKKYVEAEAENALDEATETEREQSGDKSETDCLQSGDKAETERKQSGDTSETIEREIDIDSLSLSPPIIPPTPSGAEGTETADEILTAGERERLTALMGEEMLTLYLANLKAYIAEGGKVRNPSATIEKFWREDTKKSGKKSGGPPGSRKREKIIGGSFDTDEFFAGALRRSYGDDPNNAGRMAISGGEIASLDEQKQEAAE